MVFVPFLIHLLIGGMTGTPMRASYGAPLWTLLPLWFVDSFESRLNGVSPEQKTQILKKTWFLTLLVLGTTVFIYWADYHFRYYFESKPADIHFPGKVIGQIVSKKWQTRYPEIPCPYLSGDWILAGHAALNMPERPSVLCYYYGLDHEKKPVGLWATDADLNRKGGMVLWTVGESSDFIPGYLAERYPDAQVAPELLTVPYQTKAKIPPLRFRYAVIPPRE